MNQFFILCFILTSAIFPCFAKSEPIAASALFRSANDFSYKLNSTSKYIAHHYFRKDGYDIIELIDIAADKKGDVFRLESNNVGRIIEFYWIDNNTLFLEYRISKVKIKRKLINIDYEKFNSGRNDYTEAFEITAKGNIIDPLKNQDNTLIFQRERRISVEAYKLTTEQLLAQQYDYKNRIKPRLSDALSYFSDGNGEVKFGFNLDSDSKELVYWFLDEQENDWIEIYRFGKKEFYFEPVGIIGDKELAVISNAKTDLKVLMVYNMETKEFGEILFQHDKYDIHSAEISAQSKKPVSVSYLKHGRLTSQYFSDDDIRSNQIIKKELPDKQFFTVSQNKGSSISILLGYSSVDSGRFYWFDSESERIIPLNALYDDHKDLKFTKTQLFNITNSTGGDIEAFLTMPKNGNGVLIVNPHGGPIGVRDNDSFDRQSQYFASRGYSVLSVNFRGSKGFGKKFMDEGRGQFGKVIESDITSAVNRIKSEHDFKFTCSMGSSYGGYSALVLVAQNPEDYDCAIGRYGVYDLPLLFNRSNMKMQEDYLKAVTKTLGKESDLKPEQSPINFAEKINVPVLLIAGKDDDVSGFEQSNRMKYRLKQLNKDVETMFYANTGHGFHSKWLWDWHELAFIDDFIRAKLKIKVPDTEIWNKVIGHEALIISDGFEFSNKVTIDKEKSFQYLQIAAQKNLPRAVHNLAVYYKSGIAIKKDINKAIELYARASELGWPNSSAYLGELYRDGEKVDKDLKKSYAYFKVAHSQKQKDAWFNILRARCLGWGVEVDVEYCISGFKGDKKENPLSARHRDSLLNDILLKPWLSDEYKEKFLAYLNDASIFNIDNKSNFLPESIETNKHGTYRETFNLDSLLYLNSNFERFWSGPKFELNYSLENENLNDKNQFVVKIRWTVSGVDPKAIFYESEKVKLITGNKGITLVLDSHDKDYKSEGIVTLEIKNLDNDILYTGSKQFDFK